VEYAVLCANAKKVKNKVTVTLMPRSLLSCQCLYDIHQTYTLSPFKFKLLPLHPLHNTNISPTWTNLGLIQASELRGWGLTEMGHGQQLPIMVLILYFQIYWLGFEGFCK
jgi:hypothetical protein